VNQAQQALLTLGASIAIVGIALLRHNHHGGPGDDNSTAAGRTYGARPEPDDGGPELERPVWTDYLTHTPGLDEELPTGIAPRRPARDEQEHE
jgi:hypothetical protein